MTVKRIRREMSEIFDKLLIDLKVEVSAENRAKITKVVKKCLLAQKAFENEQLVNQLSSGAISGVVGMVGGPINR